MWSYWVTHLQHLNWIISQKEASGTPVPEKVRIVRDFLKSMAEGGPDDVDQDQTYEEAMELAEEILSGSKSHLEVIKGGKEL
jgi:hypothetical protein